MSLVRFHRLAVDARICVADGFVSDEEISAVLGVAEDADLYAPTRDETGMAFEMPVEAHPVLAALTRRLEAALGVRNSIPDTFRFRRYGPGERHPPHVDCYEIDGAHLVATAMLWLVAEADGGETRFGATRPAPVRLSPVRGRLAVWENYRDGGEDPSSAHEGLAVWSGEKTTLTSFIYVRPGEVPRLGARLEPSDEVAGVTFEA